MACGSASRRPLPAGSSPPQPARSAASSSSALARGEPSSSARRYSNGSRLAAAASSSMKLSTTKMLRVGPTPRQNAVGTPGGSCRDRKSTRLNSSHSQISYAVFCLKKKNNRHAQHAAGRLPHDTLAAGDLERRLGLRPADRGDHDALARDDEGDHPLRVLRSHPQPL